MVDASLRFLPPLAGDNHVDLPRPTPAAHEPRVPVRDRHLGTVALDHLGGVDLDPVAAIEAPDDQPHASRSGVAERHGWAAVAFHRPLPRCYRSLG